MKSSGVYQVYSTLVGFELQFSPHSVPSPLKLLKTISLLNPSGTDNETSSQFYEGNYCPRCQIMTLGFPPLLDLGPPNADTLSSSQMFKQIFCLIFCFLSRRVGLKQSRCFWIQYSINRPKKLPR